MVIAIIYNLMRRWRLCMIYLEDFANGERARLIDFGDTAKDYRSYLMAFGITKGTEIMIIRKAPFGCPIQITVRSTPIALRKQEARYLQWERV